MRIFNDKPEQYQLPAIICDADKLCQVAIIQELGKRGVPLVLISKVSDACGFLSRHPGQRVVSSIPSYEEAYIDYLIHYIPNGVIFPSNDANVENISKNKQRLLAAGFHLLVADYDVMAKVLDKYQLFIAAQKCSVVCPRSFPIASHPDLFAGSEKIGFPLIVKSTNLAGGVYKLVKCQDELAWAYEQMQQEIASTNYAHRKSKLILQEWIDPQNVKLWNFNACVSKGNIVSYSMGRRIRTDVRQDGTLGSILLSGKTQFNNEIYDQNSRLIQLLNYEGIVETEWSLSENTGKLVLYDFNPRPSGYIRWVFRSGVPMAEHYYRLSLNLPVNGDFAMQEGIKYHKIFYHQNDFVFAVDNPNYSVGKALSVLKENLAAIVAFQKHAIDIFDASDLRPSLKELNYVFFAVLKSLAKLFLRVLHVRKTNHIRGGRS